jgi:hypothetical protein
VLGQALLRIRRTLGLDRAPLPAYNHLSHQFQRIQVGLTLSEKSSIGYYRLCLVITLTTLDELRKIRGIQDTKEKTTSELSSFDRHAELLIA